MATAVRPDLDHTPVQRVSAGGASGGDLPSDGGGRDMPEDVRAKMEGAFGTDFSAVRIHEGARSGELGARAYTQGTDIHFASGEYQPSSQSGQALLGHELTHVVQQSQGRVNATAQTKGVGVNDDAGLEREADEMGARAARGEPVSAEAAMVGSRPQAAAGARRAESAGSPRGAAAQMLKTPTDEERERLDNLLVEMRPLLEAAHATARGCSGPGKPEDEKAAAQQVLGQLLLEINAMGDAAIKIAVEIFDLSDVDLRKISTKIQRSGPQLAITPFPEEDSGLGHGAYGVTSGATGEMRLGPDAFASSATLGSTIGHELFHSIHHSGKNKAKNPAESAQQEVEAHTWELKHADVFRLSEEEIEATKTTIEHYRQSAKSGDEGCFLTTACVAARGLSDDCQELMTLRAFRDGYMAALPGGQALIDEYYRIAPNIVKAIQAREDEDEIWEDIYGRIRACIADIELGNDHIALARYAAMVRELSARFLQAAPA